MKVDKHADFFMQQTLDDHQKGRMTAPVPVSELDLSEVLLRRRFSREQGVTKEGKMKLRAVDDKSGDGTNASTRPTAKPRPDGIDALVQCARLLKKWQGAI